jgi:hypothetical protein
MYARVNHKELRTLLSGIYAGEINKPLLIVGTSGIGKTTTIWETAAEQGKRNEILKEIKKNIGKFTPQDWWDWSIKNKDSLPFIVSDIRLADIPKEDFAGFPEINKEKHEVKYYMLDFISTLYKRSKNEETAWFIKSLTTVLNTEDSLDKKAEEVLNICGKSRGKIVLFFDEINRMEPDMVQIIMEIVGNRTLHQKPLKDDVKIIAAMNPSDSAVYLTTAFNDVAFLRRWLRVNLVTSIDEWKQYMETTKEPVEDTVYEYLKSKPELFIREEVGLSPINPSIWTEINHVIHVIRTTNMNNATVKALELQAIIGDPIIANQLIQIQLKKSITSLNIFEVLANPEKIDFVTSVINLDDYSDSDIETMPESYVQLLLYYAMSTLKATNGYTSKNAKKNKIKKQLQSLVSNVAAIVNKNLGEDKVTSKKQIKKALENLKEIYKKYGLDIEPLLPTIDTTEDNEESLF